MKKLLQGKELQEHAIKLGIDIHTLVVRSSMTTKANEYELQRRVIEAERHIRESHLWLIAVISAGASIISAITAFVAVYFGK